jgi:inhibitor of cysteine peptidase
MKLLNLILITAVLLSLCLTACGSKEEPKPQVEPAPEATEQQDTTAAEGQEEKQGMIHRWALIDDFEIRMTESLPVKVNVLIKGYLSDGCTRIDRIRRRRSGNEFTVSISTIRPLGLNCSQALVPFEETVVLQTRGLKAGEYTVTVNQKSKTFTLAVDNVAGE